MKIFIIPAFGVALAAGTLSVESWNVSKPALPCGAVRAPSNVLQDPPQLESRDGILRVTLHARKDTAISPAAPERMCYAFEDSDGRMLTQAPTLRLHPGDRLLLTLSNELPPAGTMPAMHVNGPAIESRKPRVPGEDHPITHFTNLHFHGLSVSPNAPSDDVLHVLLPPGGKARYTYRIDIPRNEPSGLYWYHAHVHGESKEQVKAGLTGLIYVDAGRHRESETSESRDRFLIVRAGDDDFSQYRTVVRSARVRMVHGGPTAAGQTRTIVPNELVPFPFASPAECPAGGGGPAADAEFLSVNDIPIPETPAGTFPIAYVPARHSQVWHIANTAAISYLDLVMLRDGRAIPIRVVGRDGIPVRDEDGEGGAELSHVVLAPAARADIVVSAPPEGHKQALITRGFDTGCAGDTDNTRALVDIEAVRQTESAPAKTEIETAASFSAERNLRFEGVKAARPSKFRQFVLTEYPLADGSRTDFYFTELTNPNAYERPFGMNDPPEVIVKSGTVEEWLIQNYTQEVHAFHIHQLHFLVERGVTREEGLGQLLDTVNVPFGRYEMRGLKRVFVPGWVRLRMDFRDPAIVGEFVYHCHILEHEDNGMMRKILVTR